LYNAVTLQANLRCIMAEASRERSHLLYVMSIKFSPWHASEWAGELSRATVKWQWVPD